MGGRDRKEARVERALPHSFKDAPWDSGPTRPLHLNAASRSSTLQMIYLGWRGEFHEAAKVHEVRIVTLNEIWIVNRECMNQEPPRIKEIHAQV